jgi:hypothetical protein
MFGEADRDHASPFSFNPETVIISMLFRKNLVYREQLRAGEKA